MGKLDYITIKNFCASEDNIKRVQRKPTEWEKTLASHIHDQQLASRIYKELFNSIIKKQMTQLKNGKKKLNRQFSKKIYKWSVST